MFGSGESSDAALPEKRNDIREESNRITGGSQGLGSGVCEQDFQAFTRCLQSMVEGHDDVSRCEVYYDACQLHHMNDSQNSGGYGNNNYRTYS
jgi:hypothetical protein